MEQHGRKPATTGVHWHRSSGPQQEADDRRALTRIVIELRHSDCVALGPERVRSGAVNSKVNGPRKPTALAAANAPSTSTYVPVSDSAPVRVGKVERDKPFGRATDRRIRLSFLDVRVIEVEYEANVRLADVSREVERVVSRVDEERYVAIDRLNPYLDSSLSCV